MRRKKLPYIRDEFRRKIDQHFHDYGLNHFTPRNGAEMNYIVCTLVRNFLGLHPEIEKNIAYSQIQEMIGALECAKMELYRRIAVPYEDQKIDENGDFLIFDAERGT